MQHQQPPACAREERVTAKESSGLVFLRHHARSRTIILNTYMRLKISGNVYIAISEWSTSARQNHSVSDLSKSRVGLGAARALRVSATLRAPAAQTAAAALFVLRHAHGAIGRYTPARGGPGGAPGGRPSAPTLSIRVGTVEPPVPSSRARALLNEP